MYREIRKKKAILENRGPLTKEQKKEISQLNLMDMIYTSMRLSGSQLTREDINSILEGNVVREATINEHMMITRYVTLQKEMEDMIEMGDRLSMHNLKKLYSIIEDAEIDSIQFRRTNPTLYELSYNPPHFQDVPEQMEILMQWMGRDNEGETGNELLKAAHFHNRLVEAFPFENGNREMARIGLYYHMMSCGYPAFTFNLSESEYNTAIVAYLKKDDISPLYNSLERSLYNKMEQLLLITSEEY